MSDKTSSCQEQNGDLSSAADKRSHAPSSSQSPLATYRLQFNSEFTFKQAGAIANYLSELGISHVYSSPIFRAAPHSTHGYDVCSFEEINPVLGGRAGFEAFAQRLRELGLGLLVDMVPNHMAADAANPWWWDTLKRGPCSPFGFWFDIDWQRPDPELRGKVLLPVLEDDYQKVLHAGKLKLLGDDGLAALAYYERRFPISQGAPGAGHAPAGTDQATTLSSPTRLEDLLAHQHYRLADWRLAPEQINYRRFFDITDLVSLRMERPEVFEATHKVLLELVRAGLISCLRIDHPDGLWDPKQYCARLQAALAGAGGTASATARPHHCVFVEKILTGDEQLPADWPVCGTTGYDFLNRLNGLFINPASEAALTELYQEFSGDWRSFARVAYESKKLVLRKSFMSELKALTRRVLDLAAKLPLEQRLAPASIRESLLEIIAAFPVYRTYITEDTVRPSAEDRGNIHTAVKQARAMAPQIEPGVLDEVTKLLLLDLPQDASEARRRDAREFVMRFQQLTAPAMAKGLEDTAFYNYHRLISLNEVGGDPARFGVEMAAFHADNAARAVHWPHSLLASATHDTKRGEDFRARINVLSELPEEWAKAVTHWRGLNAGAKRLVKGVPASSANDEYLLYQTLLGAWPMEPFDLQAFQERIVGYMLKAIKEAKNHTSWTTPNAEYEAATAEFVARILTPAGAFLEAFRPLQQRVAFFGQFNSLAQTLIKLTAPGTPDFYQGTELWDFSLVDPDNRRPVDFEVRRGYLAERKAAWAENSAAAAARLLEHSTDGRIKMHVVWRALLCRQRHRELFESGRYEPLSITGGQAEHVCAFARRQGREALLTIAPRLVVGLTGGAERPPIGEAVWKQTSILLPTGFAQQEFVNALTGEHMTSGADGKLAMADVLRSFPVALLEPATMHRLP